MNPEQFAGAIKALVQSEVRLAVVEALAELRPNIRGEKGEPGAVGPLGLPGPAGPAGPAGATGQRGEKGESGGRGEPGEKGEKGERGETGAKGEAGPAGADGADGAVGPVGSVGPHGERGETGAKGEAGDRGPQGPEGPRGSTGEKGSDGKDGRDGRDGIGAVELRSVAADEIASVFRALSFDGERKVTIAGQTLEFPVMIQRGVWRPDGQYVRGDVVTFGGSQFHCNRATHSKPEEDDSWTLVVKRGRDGRDKSER